MADGDDITILDGTNADVDILIGEDSIKCSSTSIATEITRELIRYSVFCAGAWRRKIPSLKDFRCVIQGFLAKGNAASKYGTTMLSDAAIVVTAQYDDGCVVTATCYSTRDAGSIAAAALSARTLELENATDDLAIAWAVV